MQSQISIRQGMIERLKWRQSQLSRRLHRWWNELRHNLMRHSGTYALLSSVMCLCLIGLRSNEYQEMDDMDAELHYTFHNWKDKVQLAAVTRQRVSTCNSKEKKIIQMFIC